MKNEKIKIETSRLVATCLQRMIYEELVNQQVWRELEMKDGADTSVRNEIINGLKELQITLENQNVKRYVK